MLTAPEDGAVGGEIAGSIVACVAHLPTDTLHRMTYPPGSPACRPTFGPPAPRITFPLGATIAQARTLPLMYFVLNLLGLIVWFWICEPLIVKAA